MLLPGARCARGGDVRPASGRCADIARARAAGGCLRVPAEVSKELWPNAGPTSLVAKRGVAIGSRRAPQRRSGQVGCGSRAAGVGQEPTFKPAAVLRVRHKSIGDAERCERVRRRGAQSSAKRQTCYAWHRRRYALPGLNNP